MENVASICENREAAYQEALKTDSLLNDPEHPDYRSIVKRQEEIRRLYRDFFKDVKIHQAA